MRGANGSKPRKYAVCMPIVAVGIACCLIIVAILQGRWPVCAIIASIGAPVLGCVVVHLGFITLGLLLFGWPV